jgi:hypothetical protein
MKRLVIATAAALAVAAPAATAMPAYDQPAPPDTTPVAAPAPSADGFDWGSAAAGAGGSAVLIALMAAGVAAAGRARVPSTR